jgi:cell division protein FtsI/penicillin-binding protein 2
MNNQKRNASEVHITRSRLIIVLSAIVIFSACIIGKLFLLQIVHGNEFAKRADRQYAPSATELFDRGNIYATTKEGVHVELATVTSGFKLAIVPDQIKDKEAVFTALSPYISLDHDTFIQRASKVGDPYEQIDVHLTKESADAITTLNLAGVNLYKDSWRSYPGNSLASKVVGFVGYKGDLLTGRYGLEKYYNSTLVHTQANIYTNFFAEVFDNLKDSFSNSQEEGDIVTSIEPSVQAHLDQQLYALMDKYSPDEAGGIIMDPRDGSILGMSALPDFDPNNYNKVTSVGNFENPLVEHSYELGSVIKALTMAAGIDTDVVKPTTKYTDKGFVILNGKKINNFDLKGRGVITMQDVLNESLNTGAVFVMQKLGHDRIRDYFYRFGLNSKTGVDLPNEAQNQVANLQSPRDVEYGTASFGQGIALTPVAAIRAFSALANAGVPVNPHVATGILLKDNVVKPISHPDSLPMVIKPETALTVSRMLVTAYEQGPVGKATHEQDKFWSIAAKTGTAQIAIPGGGGYYPDKYLHSMVGYFPAYNPKFIIILYMLNPHDAQYASSSVAYNFQNIAHFLLAYYQVPPDH